MNNKAVNRILIIMLMAGFLTGIAGSIMKIQWIAYADIFLLTSIILTISALAGLVAANTSSIGQLFKKQ